MSTDQKIEASSLLVSTIKGVGEKLSSTLSKLGIKTIEDLLFHFPVGYQDRTILKKIAELEPKPRFCSTGCHRKSFTNICPKKNAFGQNKRQYRTFIFKILLLFSWPKECLQRRNINTSLWIISFG